MANLLGAHVDKEKARAGVWMEWRGMRFRVAKSTNNKAYDKALFARMLELHDGDAEADLTEDELDEAMVYAMARAVVTDWEDVELGEGDDAEPVPYSVEACEAVLREFPELLWRVQVFSSQADNYRGDTDEIAERLGNILSGGSETRSA